MVFLGATNEPRLSLRKIGALAGSAEETVALDELLAAIRRGAHARELQQIVRSEQLRGVQRKVAVGRESIERQRVLGLHLAAGGKP